MTVAAVSQLSNSYGLSGKLKRPDGNGNGIIYITDNKSDSYPICLTKRSISFLQVSWSFQFLNYKAINSHEFTELIQDHCHSGTNAVSL